MDPDLRKSPYARIKHACQKRQGVLTYDDCWQLYELDTAFKDRADLDDQNVRDPNELDK